MNRILVVEDEPGIALALKDSLRMEGHEVEVAYNGVAGSQRARDQGFDLILLDVMLPGKNGFEICRELRQSGSKTPLILLTARAQESDRILGLDLGASDYVVKPFSSSELMARVRRLLREQEKTRQDQRCFEDEVRGAFAVQQGLFPRYQPPVEKLEYSAVCRPAKGVSGDYYDFIPLEAGKLGLLLADVSGKGMAAALLGASLHAFVRAFAPALSSRCGEVLRRVNRLLFDTTTAERYATVFYSVYDPGTETLTYANAGHYAPWLIRGTAVTRFNSLTAPVGMFAEIPECDRKVQLKHGDWLLVTSDGIPEACNDRGHEFGDAGLLRTHKSCSRSAPYEFCTAVIDAVTHFTGENQADDLTMLAARVSGARSGNGLPF